jgi:hypothetical protein
MTTKHTGGPAFPSVNHPDIPVNNGMTLRDWFAGLAMQGLLADGEHKEVGWKRVVDAAYAYADAMLDAREEE